MNLVRRTLITTILCVGLVSLAADSSAAATSCSTPADVYSSSSAQLQQCGLSQIPLTSTTPMLGGGASYNYAMPDGQVYSLYQAPVGFDPTTASPTLDEAYGIPTPPPTSSPAYTSWQRSVSGPVADPVPRPYLVTTASPLSHAGLLATPAVSNSIWAGYGQGGSGWTEAQAWYDEPTLGVTHCSNPAALFWAGIGGVNSGNLGQDGTASGSEGLHQGFFEVLPSGAAFPGLTVPAGSIVGADVQYNGGGNYAFDIQVNGVNHLYGATGNYDGSTVEEIAERLGPPPLLNFQSVTIDGLNERTHQPLPSGSTEYDMTGYATTGPLSNGTFTVTENNCAG